ncbi:MAG: MerR family transcriptional regulator [Fusobacterium sp.]|nr:MerR family transcriptional regulator [Fusobacterium sp.]
MNIGEVSRKYELSVETLRYYERIGLIPEVPRNKSGMREYDENSCNWISFIKCMRKAGVGIEALIDYVKLFYQGDKTIEARKEILLEQRKNLLDRLEDIQESLELINFKIDNYESVMAKPKNLK